MDKTKVLIRQGKDLTRKELSHINQNRQRIFETNEVINPMPENRDWNNIFFLIEDSSEELLAFGKLHTLKLKFKDETYEALCFSTVFSLQKGGGKMVMDEIKRYSHETGKTVIGFCETSLLPFYKKVGWKILTPQDNQFVYQDISGKLMPGIVPGEVIFTRGKDGVMDKILSSEDKTVEIPLKHYE